MSHQPASRQVNVLGALGDAVRRTLRGAGYFVGRVYEKAAEDDIFFLAGAISFYALIASGPFFLLLIAAVGVVLRATIENPTQVAVDYMISVLPATDRLVRMTETFVEGIIAGSTGFGVAGLLLFIWFSTSVIGALRTALRDIFDLQEDRGIVLGKLYDAFMVLVTGTLLLANTTITVALEAIGTFGLEWLGVQDGGELRLAQALGAQLLAFAFIFLMFLFIYRYLPARRTPWRVSLVAATFTSVAWELLKALFAWYVANVARYSTAYGNLATLIILFFWIYYSAVVFILGGEVAKVYETQRRRRQQKEMLE